MCVTVEIKNHQRSGSVIDWAQSKICSPMRRVEFERYFQHLESNKDELDAILPKTELNAIIELRDAQKCISSSLATKLASRQQQKLEHSSQTKDAASKSTSCCTRVRPEDARGPADTSTTSQGNLPKLADSVNHWEEATDVHSKPSKLADSVGHWEETADVHCKLRSKRKAPSTSDSSDEIQEESSDETETVDSTSALPSQFSMEEAMLSICDFDLSAKSEGYGCFPSAFCLAQWLGAASLKNLAEISNLLQ